MRALVISTLVLLACEPPPVTPGADRRQNTHSARIEGTVVVSSTARGNVVVLLYDAARLPPPTGTGRPLTFALVPRETIFAGAHDGDVGPFTAPFAFSLIAGGKYQIRAFLDANDDWVPWYGVTNEVNAGDVGGAAIDASRNPRTLEVTVSDDRPSALLEVPVTVADASRVPVDRPVFEVTTAGAAPALNEATLAASAPLQLDLRVKPINDGAVVQAQPAFLVRFVDDNGDGMPDDANADGVPDVWPRVVVRKLADAAGSNPLADENDLDRNGVIDETGADYDHLNPANGSIVPADGKPDLVVLAAGINVAELAPQLVDMNGRVKTAPTPMTRLPLLVRPTAVDATDSRRPIPLRALPEGRYAITIIQQTGQTWRVPNELQEGIAGRYGLPVVASQAFHIRVGPKP